jgi:purine-nucleoside phosphorylase
LAYLFIITYRIFDYFFICLKGILQIAAMSHNDRHYIHRSRAFLEEKGVYNIDAALITGTGLGGFEKQFDELWSKIPYSQVPAFSTTTVEGHEGSLYFGRIGERRVVLMSGRFHYYEGYSMEQIARPIRVLALLGAKDVYVSSVTGSTRADIDTGDLVLIKDHINFMPANPLRGPNADDFGPRFPDFSNVYDKDLRTLAMETARELNMELKQGVYFCMAGPNLETPAEYQMIHRLGGDVVGMSTVPEVIVARHAGLRVCVVSLVVNKCFPIEDIRETTVETVLTVTEKKAGNMHKLIAALIEKTND